MKRAVALGWHVHPFEDLLALVRRAEALGYDAAYGDGDVTMLPSRGEGDVLDGWTLTVALLAGTSRIGVGSLRVAGQWNVARLAQASVTAERIWPGRLRFLISIGGQAADRAFGFPDWGPGRRIAHLDATLSALRALWAGETVSRQGDGVTLFGARVRPVPPSGTIPVEIAGRGPRLLRVVARHADRWEINLPPVRRRVEPASSALERACREIGRDPGTVARSMWVFTRLAADPTAPALREEFRHLNPWFGDLSAEELEEAMVTGTPEVCQARLAEIADAWGLEQVVVDLSGVPRARAEEILEACAPGEARVDSPISST